jgi:hypothetical protein
MTPDFPPEDETLETPGNPASNAPDICNRLQIAIERVIEDPALTGALTDDAALILLHWAETEIEQLALETAAMDDEEAWEHLNPALHRLRRYIRHTANTSADTDDPTGTLHRLLTASPPYTEDTDL